MIQDFQDLMRSMHKPNLFFIERMVKHYKIKKPDAKHLKEIVTMYETLVTTLLDHLSGKHPTSTIGNDGSSHRQKRIQHFNLPQRKRTGRHLRLIKKSS